MVVSTCAIVLILCKATVLPWQLFANTSLNPVLGFWLSVIVWVLAFGILYMLICALIPCRIAKASARKRRF